MKTFSVLSLLFVSMCCLPLAAQKTTKLLHKNDLSNWHLQNQDGSWIIEKGVLTIENSDKKQGNILWTNMEYNDFEFQTEYKELGGTIDSGVFLRSENDQIQIGISGSLKRDLTASPYIPGKRYPVEADVADVLKKDDWNTMKIICKGNSYTVWLNNKEVMTYTSEGMPLVGPIGLQLHPGNTMKIAYKNMTVKSL